MVQCYDVRITITAQRLLQRLEIQAVFTLITTCGPKKDD
jgi:hypothetical protein